MEPKVAAAKAVRVVTCKTLKDTGRVSYIFMIHANTPREWMSQGFTAIWGILKRDKKSSDHFAPFTWAKVQRGELPPDTKFVGDDGVRPWNINLFTGEGFFLAAGWDEGGADEFGELLKNYPERSTILMLREDFDAFETGCKAHEVEVVVIHHDGELRTS